ncbi:MAG: Foldase protein PrsA [Candidatus Giovannonibacteria bacterium GW2011_GWA2_44_13b]|uniref:peptidylprolyl isomerase n=2 Tax=Candidatus Giovannoniibacteriota TaxID=1752738 RepID=A0A0G1H359_9BACT|nr:MAG: Foldase protein PrsA [Candidatus Giovannonibacteria bacterium GW2011_GWA2_44_13b]OGF82076.1 MAG: hypothetical protein A2924_01930 [Candidatus Giovannonibacteria bacterium RIFCSPLOWO2_01_FULL_44_16]
MDFLKKIAGYLKTKTAVVAVAVLLLGGLGYYYKNLLVVATVNGSPISRWSVLSQLEASSGKSVLDSIITKKLIENEAASKNVSVTAEDVDTEIKSIEERLKSQNTTLETALKSENMTMEKLKEQVTINKALQKLVADKLAVSDEDVDAYLKQMGGEIPTTVSEAEFKAQIKTQLQNQKFSTEAQTLIDSLRAQANIRYFVEY